MQQKHNEYYDEGLFFACSALEEMYKAVALFYLILQWRLNTPNCIIVIHSKA